MFWNLGDLGFVVLEFGNFGVLGFGGFEVLRLPHESIHKHFEATSKTEHPPT